MLFVPHVAFGKLNQEKSVCHAVGDTCNSLTLTTMHPLSGEVRKVSPERVIGITAVSSRTVRFVCGATFDEVKERRNRG